ncbi:hypothetical protein BYT27DRAFT_7313567 [Phlegmacium glaucopus]|nr:hypothetical protein BYT27DRAFT_7313567 [Phlegmacium glaucopus]
MTLDYVKYYNSLHYLRQCTIYHALDWRRVLYKKNLAGRTLRTRCNIIWASIMSSTPSEEASLLNKLNTTPLAKFNTSPKIPVTFDVQGLFRVSPVYDIMAGIHAGLGPTLSSAWIITRQLVSKYLNMNIDLVVAMPCGCFVLFHVGQATALKEHSVALSASQATAQSHISRGLFDWLLHREKMLFKFMHKYEAAEKMNFSHIITEFSFGPHFPYIVQPLDDSFKATDKNLIAFQYFLYIVQSPKLHLKQTLYALINIVLYVIHGLLWKHFTIFQYNTPLLTGFPSPGIPSPYINSATSTSNPGTPGFVGLGYLSGSFGPIPSPGGIQASTNLGHSSFNKCRIYSITWSNTNFVNLRS